MKELNAESSPKPLRVALKASSPNLNKEDTSIKQIVTAAYDQMKQTSANYTNIDRLNSSSGGSQISSDLNNINNGISPWNNTCDCVDVQEAIIMCQKAYWNVSIFRQTIDVQSEFCNSDLYFEGPNKAAVSFFEAWDKKIKGWNFRDQFFREFFRSSNIILHRIDGEMPNHKIRRKITENKLTPAKVPIRYVLMNPAHIKAGDATDFTDSVYYKFLNNYEVKLLKQPYEKMTESQKALYDTLDEETKKQLKEDKYGNQQTLKIKLNPETTHAIFAKKQDYEPLAVPMYYPVLYDINLKLELKKAESILARTVEHAILLVTAGDKDTDGASTQELLDELTMLFQTESVGRVLVSDYTTDVSFITPDLNKILGPAKYEVVNKDIADGLMNIFFKEEKFSNSSIKIKVFMERLREARKCYIENFLKPEMKRISKELGFKNIPEPKFKNIDLKDEAELWKIYNRLAELGLITPEELFDAFDGKNMPLPEDSIVSQKKMKKYREQGLYQPILSNKTSGEENGGGREKGVKVKDQNKKPIGASTHRSSMTALKEVVSKADKVFRDVMEAYKKKNAITRLSKQKRALAYNIAESIYLYEDINNWESSIEDYLENPLKTGEVKDEIHALAEEHSIDYTNAAFLFYSKDKKACN